MTCSERDKKYLIILCITILIGAIYLGIATMLILQTNPIGITMLYLLLACCNFIIITTSMTFFYYNIFIICGFHKDYPNDNICLAHNDICSKIIAIIMISTYTTIIIFSASYFAVAFIWAQYYNNNTLLLYGSYSIPVSIVFTIISIIIYKCKHTIINEKYQIIISA